MLILKFLIFTFYNLLLLSGTNMPSCSARKNIFPSFFHINENTTRLIHAGDICRGVSPKDPYLIPFNFVPFYFWAPLFSAILSFSIPPL